VTRDELENLVGIILTDVGEALTRRARRDRRPVRIGLGFPLLSRKDGSRMANLELASDTVATIPILAFDAEGAAVPAQSGDSFTVTAVGPTGSSPNALTATISGSSLVLTPGVVASPGWVVTIADADGLTSFPLTVDVVEDLSPKSLGIGAPTFTPQAVPTAPGP
jgi:hypothetical protein